MTYIHIYNTHDAFQDAGCKKVLKPLCKKEGVKALNKARRYSEGGTIRLDTLIELEFLNSSFSSSNFSIRAF